MLAQVECLAVSETTGALVQAEAGGVQAIDSAEPTSCELAACDMNRSMPPFSSPSQCTSTMFAAHLRGAIGLHRRRAARLDVSRGRENPRACPVPPVPRISCGPDGRRAGSGDQDDLAVGVALFERGERIADVLQRVGRGHRDLDLS